MSDAEVIAVVACVACLGLFLAWLREADRRKVADHRASYHRWKAEDRNRRKP